MRRDTQVAILREPMQQLDDEVNIDAGVGRNEPALHHYHNTFPAALQMPPMECID